MLNRALLREVNERIAELLAVEQPTPDLGLLCECGRSGCDARITLPAADFDLLRHSPGRYAVAPEHVREGVDEVVDRREAVVLVQP
jgi:hypothetical protein